MVARRRRVDQGNVSQPTWPRCGPRARTLVPSHRKERPAVSQTAYTRADVRGGGVSGRTPPADRCTASRDGWSSPTIRPAGRNSSGVSPPTPDNGGGESVPPGPPGPLAGARVGPPVDVYRRGRGGAHARHPRGPIGQIKILVHATGFSGERDALVETLADLKLVVDLPAAGCRERKLFEHFGLAAYHAAVTR